MKLRLGPLPKTDTVKVTITVTIALKEKLDQYADLHSQTWKQPVDATMLIPHILEQFVSRDKVFKTALRSGRDKADITAES
jgi:hypothetical protein